MQGCLVGGEGGGGGGGEGLIFTILIILEVGKKMFKTINRNTNLTLLTSEQREGKKQGYLCIMVIYLYINMRISLTRQQFKTANG